MNIRDDPNAIFLLNRKRVRCINTEENTIRKTTKNQEKG
jgi:hypothetical protein